MLKERYFSTRPSNMKWFVVDQQHPSIPALRHRLCRSSCSNLTLKPLFFLRSSAHARPLVRSLLDAHVPRPMELLGGEEEEEEEESGGEERWSEEGWRWRREDGECGTAPLQQPRRLTA